MLDGIVVMIKIQQVFHDTIKVKLHGSYYQLSGKKEWQKRLQFGSNGF